MEWLASAPDAHKRVAIEYRARKKKGAGALIRLPIQRASDAQGLAAGGLPLGLPGPCSSAILLTNSGNQAIRYFGGETPDAAYPETLICGR
jgi:hypothetical protein